MGVTLIQPLSSVEFTNRLRKPSLLKDVELVTERPNVEVAEEVKKLKAFISKVAIGKSLTKY